MSIIHIPSFDASAVSVKKILNSSGTFYYSYHCLFTTCVLFVDILSLPEINENNVEKYIYIYI